MPRCIAVALVVAVIGLSVAPVSATKALSRVRVPAVVGLKQDAAVTRLRRVGFSARVTAKANLVFPRGVVAAQVPAAGTYLARGAVVAVVVSSGRPRVIIPS